MFTTMISNETQEGPDKGSHKSIERQMTKEFSFGQNKKKNHSTILDYSVTFQ